MKSYIDRGPYYDDLNVEERERACNGMGAAWMRESLRKILDRVFGIFKDAVDVHDLGYEHGLTIEDKIAEDKRMLSNMRKAVWHELRITQWNKMIRFFGYAKICYLIVKYTGDKAFWNEKVRLP